MNKQDLITAIAEKTGLTKKDTEVFLAGYETAVTDALIAGDKVQLIGFGTYEVVSREAREGRNPQTGMPMQIAASKSIKFKIGKKLKDALNA